MNQESKPELEKNSQKESIASEVETGWHPLNSKIENSFETLSGENHYDTGELCDLCYVDAFGNLSLVYLFSLHGIILLLMC